MVGCSSAFLCFNKHPAKIFMGDTGSLFLGGLAVAAVFSMKNPLLIIFLGGVYIIEGLSVIMQVIYFKITKKRIFKMAPIHHHLEKSGFSENKICLIAILLTAILSLLSKLFIPI
jgi:phospho-N-acetylmuramoyl-pentapeptide-transferase